MKNGFHVISIKYSKKLRKKIKPINIIYKPVKSPEKNNSVLLLWRYIRVIQKFLCRREKIIAWNSLWVLLLWKFFWKSWQTKRHIENCSGLAGIIYNFNNKNLITFEDNWNQKQIWQWQCILTLKQLLQPTTVSIQNKKKCLLCLLRAVGLLLKYMHTIYLNKSVSKKS